MSRRTVIALWSNRSPTPSTTGSPYPSSLTVVHRSSRAQYGSGLKGSPTAQGPGEYALHHTTTRLLYRTTATLSP